ncbi:MAG: glycosyltransferase family 2 protein [Candidatus Omnitrophica bacterium]|nr:glycosyltransferase family 2 protein [Candidatus Omnitrophota bacterium]
MSDKLPVSVAVITRNEAPNIAGCLESVRWADELIVVDDFSTDGTDEIARRYTDKVFSRRMNIEGAHRNWAYQKAANEWVLSLDADEMASPEMYDEIAEMLKSGTEYNAFAFPLKNFIGDYWVRYGGWYPASKLRFFRKHKFKYEEVSVHPRAILSDGHCGQMKSDIIHKGYPDFAHFLDSLNRQTTLEAQKWAEDNRSMSLARALRKAHDRFFKTYFLKKGYKDGFIGFLVAVFAFMYQFMSFAKLWEIKIKRKQP